MYEVMFGSDEMIEMKSSFLTIHKLFLILMVPWCNNVKIQNVKQKVNIPPIPHCTGRGFIAVEVALMLPYEAEAT